MTNYFKQKLYYMRVNETAYNPHFSNLSIQKNMDHRQLINHYCPRCAHPQPLGMPEQQWDMEMSQIKDNEVNEQNNIILLREDEWSEEMKGEIKQEEINIWHGYGRKGNPWI